MKKILLTAALVLAASSAIANITGSKHDMSSSGPSSSYGNATDQAAGNQLCVYCHTPHNAKQPALLWNRNTVATVTLYDKSVSTTLNYTALAQIATSSMECQSCHDGSIAVNAYVSATNPETTKITTSANLGTDLTKTHPIGFSYATAAVDGDIIASGGTINLPLFKNGAVVTDSMECATCHDVHGKNNTANGRFLRINNAASNLCKNCHNK